MKVIEIPKFNEDGSVEAMVSIGPEQAKSLLQFALNVFMAAGSGNVSFTRTTKDDTLQ